VVGVDANHPFCHLHKKGINMQENNNIKYIIYARKSTDVSDKQLRSIDDQLAELREYAKNRKLVVVDELIEKQSAKTGGKRPIFKQLVARIKSGEASGILAWHPDRLTRNMRDAADIMELIDDGYLQDLASPTISFTNDPTGKLMLSMSFGQAKYYIDSLRENVKRGFKQKCLRGEYPTRAPFGYLNDARNKTIIVDKNIAPQITQAFELYATGDYSYRAISDYLYDNNVRTTLSQKRLSSNIIKLMLSNVFYTGLFKYSGQIYQGQHKPIVSKELFDKCQEVMNNRSKTKVNTVKVPHPYGSGLIKCATCGMSVYPETHTITQKNGVVRQYTHYRCTKKNKSIKCNEPYISADKLDEQISALIESYSLPKHVAEYFYEQADLDKVQSDSVTKEFITKADTELIELEQKIRRLNDGYADGLFERDYFSDKKVELLGRKQQLEQQLDTSKHTGTKWYENLIEWTEQAETLGKVARVGTGAEKRTACRKLCGTKLTLGSALLEVSEAKNRGEAAQKGENLGTPPWGALVAIGSADDRFAQKSVSVLY
jgi:DNA invertase Pin-like site-specific DNA recombinase